MKILHILPELDGGGIDRLLFDYCSRLMPEFEFDFIVSSKNKGILEQPLIDLGCTVYHVPQMRGNLKKHMKAIKSIFVINHYDIVHAHNGYKSAIDLKIAEKCGIKIRIAHSHVAYIPESFIKKIIRVLFVKLTKFYSTDLFACGLDAAKWMWGKDYHNAYLMRNAIDSQLFTYNKVKREQIRNSLRIGEKFVIGNVARFSYQKNHNFLLKVFYYIHKENPNSILMLVGRGELFDEIQKEAINLKIENNVLFLGIRNDVSDLLNAMDVFVLPSYFEGLPVTLVEVQANGLPTWVSDKITTEIKLSDNMHYLSIEEDAKNWANNILSTKPARYDVDISLSGYDIAIASKELGLKYRSLLNAKSSFKKKNRNSQFS